MVRVPWFLLLLLPARARAAVPAVVGRAAVSWPDADWPKEMGSLPLGNGDVSGQAWVERESGDLLLYLAKSDAFDINALPIKVGRLRLAFDPPLWVLGHNSSGWSQTLTPADGTVTIRDAAGAGYSVSVLIDANAPVLRVTASHATASFKLTASLQIYDAAANWRRNETRSYGQLAGEHFNVSGGNPNGMGSYCLERFLEPDTVADAAALSHHAALQESVVWYHRNEDTVSSHGVPSYYTNVMHTQGLDPAAFADPLLHRTFGAAMMGGSAGFTRADDSTLSFSGGGPSGGSAVLQAVLQTVEACDSADEWLGALSEAVSAEAARGTPAAKQQAHAATWTGLWERSYIDISAGSPPEGRAAAGAEAALTDPSSVEAVNDAYVWQRYLDLADGRDTWGVIKFNGQAFTVSENGTFGGRDLKIGGVCSADHRDWGPCNWIQNTRQPYYAAIAAGDSDVLVGILRYFNRSMQVARARVKATMGIDGVFWPETSTLFGTYDAAFLGYGCDGLGAFNQSAAGPFPFNSRADRHGADATVPAANGYTRFYSSGSLEVCFLGLEEFDASGDLGTLRSLTLPICDGVAQFYRNRFPHRNSSTGKQDLFPGQVIESYWCGNGGAGTNAWGHRGPDGKMPGPDPAAGGRPYGRNECPTDGVADVAGLHAVLSKLTSLPSGALPAGDYDASLAAWKRSLGTLPPLATEQCHYGGLPHHGGPSSSPCRTCSPNPRFNSTSCWCNGHWPCEKPSGSETVVAVAGVHAGMREHNHENHAAYAVWPFRRYGVGKPSLAVGQATYRHRPHPCNHNWCQDVADAAMLNFSSEAASSVVQRATAPPLSSSDAPSRFAGFSQHYEDYSPAVDHLSMMRIAMHEMLMGKLDDDAHSITLFPGWPSKSWDVSFKLHGALNTTVEAACVKGRLTKLLVTPPSREKDVVLYNCQK